MNPQQARQAVELLGGITKTALIVTNTAGQPVDRSALTKIIKRDKIPDWLSEQLRECVYAHYKACSDLMCDTWSYSPSKPTEVA